MSRFFFSSNFCSNNTIFEFLTNFNAVTTDSMSFQLLNDIDTNVVDFKDNFQINTTHLLNEEDEVDLFEETKNSQLESYLFLKKPSFISFFINHFIDVPICFKKSKSLRRKNFELPLLKICALLMKKGKKEKTINFFFKVFREKSSNFFDNFTPFSNNFIWIEDYLLLINRLYIQNTNTLLFLNSNVVEALETSDEDLKESTEDESEQKLIENSKDSHTKLIIKNKILENLMFVNPVFAYFIYSVDKDVRKFSRGKSGKYRFVWKYIAPYKRAHIVLKWLVKEIKFINEKTFQKRISKMFFLLNNSPQNTFTWKSKNFSHNYVFRNFKKTLMTTLKTTL